MTDISVDIFAERRVIPEDVVMLSVPSVSSRDRFVVWSVMVSAFIECFFLEGWLGRMMLCLTERDDSRLLMPAGMFFVVIGGWLLSRWMYCSVVLGFVNGW